MPGEFWIEFAVDVVAHLGLSVLVVVFILAEMVSVTAVLEVLAVTVAAHLIAKGFMHLLERYCRRK